eukprot:COSAG04_NODE_711_length_10885_cov_5.273225_5_plen_138_part_00
MYDVRLPAHLDARNASESSGLGHPGSRDELLALLALLDGLDRLHGADAAAPIGAARAVGADGELGRTARNSLLPGLPRGSGSFTAELVEGLPGEPEAWRRARLPSATLEVQQALMPEGLPGMRLEDNTGEGECALRI